MVTRKKHSHMRTLQIRIQNSRRVLLRDRNLAQKSQLHLAGQEANVQDGAVCAVLVLFREEIFASSFNGKF